ncbi:MAG: sirohydrochlorin chelatase [Alphaproteobacteria bacterium]
MVAKTGVMLCGHGSRDPRAIEEFAAVAATLRRRLTSYETEYGFLEFATPVIRGGLDRLRARGVGRVLAVPGMLFAAGHTKNDIPSVLNTYAAQHPELVIQYGRDLGLDIKLMRAAGARITGAVATADAEGAPIARYDTLLLTVGRGTSDPDANANIAKVARMLWEGLGFGWGETAYSGVTFPLVHPALAYAAKLGFRRIVVFPYFLFTGVLVRRIYAHTDLAAAAHPEIQFVKAPYLGDHKLVLDALVERVQEILDGANVMNCQLCKYREQVLGFEDEVGLAQRSHHHHVEGIGVGHAHDHGAHGHHHPYPHADHPLGPKTLADVPAEGAAE